MSNVPNLCVADADREQLIEQPRLSEGAERRRRARAGEAARSVTGRRRREQGKLAVRERVALLLDERLLRRGGAAGQLGRGRPRRRRVVTGLRSFTGRRWR